MNQLINTILTDLKDKYTEEGIDEWWNTKDELNRILNSQFRVVRSTIDDRDLRHVNLIHLGKFKPTKWFKWNKDTINLNTKEERNARDKKYRERMVSKIEESRDTSESNREIKDM